MRQSTKSKLFWKVLIVVNWGLLISSIFALKPPMNPIDDIYILILPIIIMSAIGNSYSLTCKRLGKITYFEWDKSEREKRMSFIDTSILITATSFCLCGIVLFNALIENISNTGCGFKIEHYGFFAYRIISSVIFLTNGLFCMKLHNYAFKDVLQISRISEYPNTKEDWERAIND